jgi:hypothetical protein
LIFYNLAFSRPAGEKLDEFFGLNSYFHDKTVWNEDEIENRSQYFFEKIKNIWINKEENGIQQRTVLKT